MRMMVLILATALLGAADPAAGKYFLGNWTCGSGTATTAWAWAPLQPGSDWIRNVYGDPAKPYGTAVIGFVPGLQKWVYRDFHADGGYADLTSPGPTEGRWEWTGTYYPAEGGTAPPGRVVYTVVSPTRYDRSFEALRDGSFVRMGGDSCVKR